MVEGGYRPFNDGAVAIQWHGPDRASISYPGGRDETISREDALKALRECMNAEFNAGYPATILPKKEGK